MRIEPGGKESVDDLALRSHFLGRHWGSCSSLIGECFLYFGVLLNYRAAT
jgi:hypothetical protein